MRIEKLLDNIFVNFRNKCIMLKECYDNKIIKSEKEYNDEIEKYHRYLMDIVFGLAMFDLITIETSDKFLEDVKKWVFKNM